MSNNQRQPIIFELSEMQQRTLIRALENEERYERGDNQIEGTAIHLHEGKRLQEMGLVQPVLRYAKPPANLEMWTLTFAGKNVARAFRFLERKENNEHSKRF